VKSSLTHPLIIHAVQVPGGGRIGMTLCPGKRQPHAATGPWDRDLVADMDAVKKFGAAIFITLMETAELAAAAVPTDMMEHAAIERGMAWLHLPIVDFAAPELAFENAWRQHTGTLCDALRNGQNIVVHCRGGRGRSGLVAARLLIDLGWEAEAAIADVRTANSYAIETQAQEAHVRAYRRVQASLKGRASHP